MIKQILSNKKKKSICSVNSVEQFIYNNLELVFDNSVELSEELFFLVVLSQIGLIGIVDVDWERDAPGMQAGRVVKKLGAEQVIVLLERAFGREHFQIGHLSGYADDCQIVNAVESILV